MIARPTAIMNAFSVAHKVDHLADCLPSLGGGVVAVVRGGAGTVGGACAVAVAVAVAAAVVMAVMAGVVAVAYV